MRQLQQPLTKTYKKAQDVFLEICVTGEDGLTGKSVWQK